MIRTLTGHWNRQVLHRPHPLKRKSENEIFVTVTTRNRPSSVKGSFIEDNFTSASQNLLLFEKPHLQESMIRLNVSLEDYLVDIVGSKRQFARPPISDFQVAAIGVGASGRAFVGVNLEFPGLPLSNSVHAEQFMVANAIHCRESKLELIVVTHAPCGHCRQFLSELRDAGNIRIVIADNYREARQLAEFLPRRFGPSDLLDDDFPLLMEEQRNGLNFNIDSADELILAAYHAAEGSYAPYSLSPSGVAIQTKSGDIYRGSYLESAAYNPSLPALQSALISLVSAGESYSNVERGVLVETKGARVQFGGTFQLVMAKVCPTASAQVFDI